MKFISSQTKVSADLNRRAEQLAEHGKTPLLFTRNGKLLGIIAVADVIKEDSPRAVKELQNMGIRVVMLTGDNERTAKAIGAQAGVDDVIAGVLPDGKESVIRALKEQGKVAMVGDGINDSPALSAADVGIAISDGAQIAREIADVTVGADDLHELVTLKKISNGLMGRIHRNYRLIVGINTSLIVLGVAGVFPPTTSALLHNTSTLLISLKSMNNLLDEKEEVTEENVAEAFA